MYRLVVSSYGGECIRKTKREKKNYVPGECTLPWGRGRRQFLKLDPALCPAIVFDILGAAVADVH